MTVKTTTPTPATKRVAGRRPKGDKAMTPGERQAEYRRRMRHEEKLATLETPEIRRSVLLERLKRELAAIDHDPCYENALLHRNAAAIIIRELIARYGLNAQELQPVEQPFSITDDGILYDSGS